MGRGEWRDGRAMRRGRAPAAGGVSRAACRSHAPAPDARRGHRVGRRAPSQRLKAPASTSISRRRSRRPSARGGCGDGQRAAGAGRAAGLRLHEAPAVRLGCALRPSEPRRSRWAASRAGWPAVRRGRGTAGGAGGVSRVAYGAHTYRHSAMSTAAWEASEEPGQGLPSSVSYPLSKGPRRLHFHKSFHAVMSSCTALALGRRSPSIRQASCACR